MVFAEIDEIQSSSEINVIVVEMLESGQRLKSARLAVYELKGNLRLKAL